MGLHRPGLHAAGGPEHPQRRTARSGAPQRRRSKGLSPLGERRRGAHPARLSEFLRSRVQSRLLVAECRLGEIGEVSAEVRTCLEAVRAELEDLRERDVRQVSHQLHPEALHIGLIAALQLLATRLQGALDVRLVTFRAVEEALGNVLKHAAARSATVWLGLEAGGLKLEVTDDGRGFDPIHAPPGLGLLCLGARVESAGEQWGVESRPGGPTRLWAEVPK